STQPIMTSNPAIALGLQSTRPAGRVAELGSLGIYDHPMFRQSFYPLSFHFVRAVGHRIFPGWPAPVLAIKIVLVEKTLLVVWHLRLMIHRALLARSSLGLQQLP